MVKRAELWVCCSGDVVKGAEEGVAGGEAIWVWQFAGAERMNSFLVVQGVQAMAEGLD